jgi:hypothetical protein
MALVDKLEKITLQRNQVHKPVHCTYSAFQDDGGEWHLQLDTYGSAKRKLKGKKSQTIQLNESAIRQLKEILANHG